MASVTVSMENNYRSQVDSHRSEYFWHPVYPLQQASGSLTFTRKSEKDKKVYVSGKVSTTKVGSGWGEYNLSLKIVLGR